MESKAEFIAFRRTTALQQYVKGKEDSSIKGTDTFITPFHLKQLGPNALQQMWAQIRKI